MADIIEEIIKKEGDTSTQKQTCKNLIENYKKQNPNWEEQRKKI